VTVDSAASPREGRLFRRELFALIAVPVVVAAIVWAPVWVYQVALIAVVLAAGDEMIRMTRAGGLSTGRPVPLLVLTGVLGCAAFVSVETTVVVLAATVLILPLVRLTDPSGPVGSLAGVAVEVFVVLFLGVTGASLLWLRTMPRPDAFGVQVILFLMVAVWLGDTGAYYVGKTIGRHRMAPSVSPKKTWEGLAGGIAATVGGSAVFHALWPLAMTWRQVMTVAVVLAVIAPLGDLIESQYKRDTGVKDSSNLIPGHGGLLDRTDSLFFAAPFLLAALRLMKVIQ
jgi:phosphatidate cytidylyltransferase